MEPNVRTSNQIPSKYARYSIPNAQTEFIEGDFGTFLTQEFITPQWAIGWLNFFIKEDTHLYPTTAEPMVALYSTIDGNIPCTLEGFGELVLQNRKYGFYYIPPEVKNDAFFASGDYDAMYISFSPAFLSQFIDHHPQFGDLYNRQQQEVQNGQVLPVYPITQHELGILNKIRYSNLHGKPQELSLQARIHDLLVAYFMVHDVADKVETVESEVERRIRDTAGYISHNYHLPLTVADLSKRTRLNLSKFEKMFKQVIGQSPKKYMEELRIKEAVRLLECTEITIADVAFKVGFADPNYFSSVFKKLHNVSPREYRQNSSGRS
ncbi:AraC-like DNA-binding protein [Chitinophaga sp. S165]|nr:AraC-like DNA-binding protein [Chitinophaga sp. S165]